MSTHTGTIGPAAADAVSAPLDLLLTDAAFGALRRVNPGGFDLRLAAALATQPGLVDGRGRQVLGKLGRITVGNAEVLPSRPDRRFTKPGWTDNPLLRRVVQAPLSGRAYLSRRPPRADRGRNGHGADGEGFLTAERSRG